jgi:hypothetical protein
VLPFQERPLGPSASGLESIVKREAFSEIAGLFALGRWGSWSLVAGLLDRGSQYSYGVLRRIRGVRTLVLDQQRRLVQNTNITNPVLGGQEPVRKTDW